MDLQAADEQRVGRRSGTLALVFSLDSLRLF
jgi:hypothetical protein